MNRVSDENYRQFLNREIGQGCTRTVFSLGKDAVIKVPTRPEDRGYNLREIEVWEKYKDTDKAQYLAPILDYSPSGQWLIMRKVEQLRPWPPQKVYDQFKALAETLEDMGISDVARFNCGMLDGRMVSLDYACELYDIRLQSSADDDSCHCNMCKPGSITSSFEAFMSQKI